MNWTLSGSWSRHRVIFSKILSDPACSSQVNLHWASLHLPWGMQRICRPFFLEFIYVFREIFPTSMFFCCSVYIETAQNSPGECNEFFCFEDYHYAFQETLCPVTLPHLISVFYSSLWYIPPHSCAFHTFYFTLNFLVYITTRNIFLIPVARNLIIIFNFSSQRPHLNYIFLSNVYSLATMEFSKKHKC